MIDMSLASKSLIPFLSRPFSTRTQPTITEGWMYGAQEAAIYGGYTAHHAVDFAVPLGTPVLAAADGLAVASFEEVRIHYPAHQARMWQGEPIFWGYGLFVALLHRNGLLTFYAHLHRLSEEIWEKAYIPAVVQTNADVVSPITSLAQEDFTKAYTTVSVRSGQVIGYSGITGMGIGRPTYENWRKGVPYRVNDEEHVHFAVSTTPGMTAATTYIDPFGIHGYADQYPTYDNDWSSLPGSIWVL